MAKSSAAEDQAKPDRGWRVLVWIAAGLVLAALAAVGVVWGRYKYLRANADTILRNRLVASLEARFHSPVELDTLHLDTTNGLHVTGKGLRILYLAGPTKPDANTVAPPPMLQVASFEFDTDFKELLKPTLRILTVQVRGMELHIPPHARFAGAGDDPRLRGQPRLAVTVDRIEVVDSSVEIETSAPGKLPLRFPIKSLTLEDVGLNKPLRYDATLTNPKPEGEVRATGHFGPWQKDNPRDTPIDGKYWFLHADLSSIKGLGGMLSSAGDFNGTLGAVAVEGATDTPDFRLDISDHPVALHSDFRAHVDGVTGDTWLDQVDVRVLHSVLHATGSVTRAGTAATGVTGHDTELQVTMGPNDHGRIEDMLVLAVKTAPPVLRGAMTERLTLSLPPGRESISRKLRLAGTFNIRNATFNNPGFQQTIDKLSMRAQGKPTLANAQSAQPVTSSLTGQFAQQNAVIDVSDLQLALPGATGELIGRYSLDGQTFDFHGTIQTQATASQMTTGWKSRLLRPFDSLLRRNGAGLEVPITISGTKSSPKFGVDTKRLFQ